MKNVILLLSCLLSATALMAQTATKTVQLIDSKVFGKIRTLTIYTPPNYAQEKDKKYQVIYVLADEVDMLADLVASTSTYSASKEAFGRKQHFIVVGIHTENPYQELQPKRKQAPNRVDLNPYLPDGKVELMDQYLEEEVFPFIKNNYQAYPYAIVLGEGIGGTYALYDAAKQQPLFQSCISITPNLANYEKIILEKLTQKIKKKAPATYLFIATAAVPEGEAKDRAYLNQLEATLSKNKKPSLHHQFYHQNNKDGGSVLFMTLGSSLSGYKKVVGSPIAAWLQKANQEQHFTQVVKKYYQERDQWLGYEQLPRLDELVNLATAVEVEPSNGIQLLEWARELYPQSPYVYKKQADLATASKDYQAAVAYYDKALALLEQKKESMMPRAYEFTYQLYQEGQNRAAALRDLKKE